MKKTPYGERLEPLARYLRFSKAVSYLSKKHKIKLVDLGCGISIPFYKYALSHGVNFEKYTGFDPLVSEKIKHDNPSIKIIKQSITKNIPLPDNSADYVFASAFIEHVDYPKEIINESLRILTTEGLVIMSTPTKKAKGLLEFLSFKLGLISKEGVLEHKQYFTPKSFQELLEDSRYRHSLSHEYFELGLNNLFVIKKL